MTDETTRVSDEDKAEFPRDAKPWLAMLKEAEDRDRKYHERCDKIDGMYARATSLDTSNDREFQVFWANMEVLGPTIYSRPPQPDVAPRFKDRDPVKRAAADMLQRGLETDAERDELHDTLILARDDLARLARGVVRVALTEDEEPGVPATFVPRRDFRHGPGRFWKEVGWVAFCGYYTRPEYRTRFGEPGDGVQFVSRAEARDQNEDDDERGSREAKARVWEIWAKGKRKVVWVAEGAEEIADVRDPMYELETFWPMPKPALGTLRPGTLTPIPDVVYYEDQLAEINELTDRIAKLSESLRLKGFYLAGNGEVGSAIELAMADMDNRAIMVPLSSLAALGPNAKVADAITWMPIEQVAATLTACVELRRQLMQDVYEITGLSDIMRGATEAQETLGAQQLKTQFGSLRVKQRQMEMQRLARDVLAIKAEIMAEHYPAEALMALAQTELPPASQIAQQAQAIQAQVQQQVAALMQQPLQPGPDGQPADPRQQAAQIEGQAQQQIAQLQQVVTIDAVMALLRDQRMRPFALDVETDSTIEPDRMAEKQNRVEFMSALGPLLQQGVQAMQLAPQLGAVVAESIRFVAGGFKVARTMDEAIDKLAEGFEDYQPPQPEGEDSGAAEAQAQAEMMKAQAAGQLAQAKAQEAEGKVGLMQQEMQIKGREAEIKAQETGAKIELIGAQVQKVMAEIGMARTQQAIDAERGAAEDERAERAFEREGAAQDRQFEADRKQADQQMKLAQQKARGNGA